MTESGYNGDISTSEVPYTILNDRHRSVSPRSINNHNSDVSGYEEFFGGTVECPSCRGSGRIPREQENQLVALIPFSDKRLKPRRTKMYVAIAILLCLVIAALLLFFLLPRSVNLESSNPEITPKHTYINVTKAVVSLTIENSYNISNSNFFGVKVNQLTVTILFDQKILQTDTNTTVIEVPMRSTRTLYMTMNVTFSGDEGYIALYCAGKAKSGHTILLPFQASASTSYLGHSEETTLTTYQRVKCSKEKNTRYQRNTAIVT